MGPDNVNSYLLNLALPYVLESLTYVYNLCIQQNTFPPALKAAKVIPLPKVKDLSDLITSAQYLSCLFWQKLLKDMFISM